GGKNSRCRGLKVFVSDDTAAGFRYGNIEPSGNGQLGARCSADTKKDDIRSNLFATGQLHGLHRIRPVQSRHVRIEVQLDAVFNVRTAEKLADLRPYLLGQQQLIATDEGD